MNGLTLAYIGDAYYELTIRKHLTNNLHLTNVNQLHKQAIKYTSSVAQKNIISYFIDNQIVTDDEISYFKRGRNQSGSGRKNVDAKTYHMATGFESLIGYLSIYKQKRADELIVLAIEFIEKGGTSWQEM